MEGITQLVTTLLSLTEFWNSFPFNWQSSGQENGILTWLKPNVIVQIMVNVTAIEKTKRFPGTFQFTLIFYVILVV